MDYPEIKDENVVELLDKKFVHVYDLQYKEGKHYYDCSRKPRTEILATKTAEERRNALPDAASCFLIIRTPHEEERMLFFREYRYPIGDFVLEIPAGLIDPRDKTEKDPIITTMKREIHEETGITVKDTDRIFTVSHTSFCTVGFTDEATAIVCAVIDLPDLSSLSQDGAEGSEIFNGFLLYTKKECREFVRKGVDQDGNYLPMITWASMMYFLSDFWKED